MGDRNLDAKYSPLVNHEGQEDYFIYVQNFQAQMGMKLPGQCTKHENLQLYIVN